MSGSAVRLEQNASVLESGAQASECSLCSPPVRFSAEAEPSAATTHTCSVAAKAGNINEPAGSTPANAFIKTLNTDAGFEVSDSDTQDTTNLPDTWGSFTLSLEIDESLVGHLMQFGFQSNASNFEPSGVVYDNVLLVSQ